MKAVIHIGAEKTGTTTIQNFCAANRSLLLEQGVLYPNSLGTPNQTHLAAYAINDRKIDDLRRDVGVLTAEEVPAFRKSVRESLQAEIARCDRVSTLLFSNEHLQSRLLRRSEVMRLQELVGEFADEMKIVVYLRRQDMVAVSYYSTKLKAGTTEDEPIFPDVPDEDDLPPYYDYDSMLRHYEAVFGKDNIDVRIFEPRRMVDGSLLSDFLNACRIPQRSDYFDPRRRNESLSEAGLAFFRRLNAVVPRFIDGKPNPKRGEITGIAGRHLAGPGPRADRTAAEAFYAYFRRGNRAIADRYFPALNGELFDEDFSKYDREAQRALDPIELVDFAIHLWLERTEKLEEVRLVEALKHFAEIVTSYPAARPRMDVVLTDVRPFSRELMCKYIGALLYSEQYSRAAEVARDVAAVMKARALFVLAEACARARLNDGAGIEGMLAQYADTPRLVRSISLLTGEPFRSADRDTWLSLLREGEGPNVEVYQRCLGWLSGGSEKFNQ